ncbi:MAG TPA: HAD family phosphatase [Solirubrobacteraceae bacterium]|jgi:epoxide hydrolase-like predicted phosphatase|nr:HAD family phosphatase [Solirubrobacteraceae bacterium]
MASERRGLLVDYGGVLTTNLFESFAAFCRQEGLEPDVVVQQFAGNREARELLIELECGRLPEEDFERRLAGLLGVAPEGLIDRMFAGSGPDPAMREAVACARSAGVRTGLISNSWVDRHYAPELLDGLFDGVVISAREGTRKPDPRMYELGAERIGLAPDQCVYVDDLPFNLKPAAELGMATIHHVDAQRTIAELERLLGLTLGPAPAP